MAHLWRGWLVLSTPPHTSIICSVITELTSRDGHLVTQHLQTNSEKQTHHRWTSSYRIAVLYFYRLTDILLIVLHRSKVIPYNANYGFSNCCHCLTSQDRLKVRYHYRIPSCSHWFHEDPPGLGSHSWCTYQWNCAVPNWPQVTSGLFLAYSSQSAILCTGTQQKGEHTVSMYVLSFHYIVMIMIITVFIITMDSPWGRGTVIGIWLCQSVSVSMCLLGHVKQILLNSLKQFGESRCAWSMCGPRHIRARGLLTAVFHCSCFYTHQYSYLSSLSTFI